MTEQTNKTTGNDIAYSVVKGGLGAIPVIGSLATEIFGLIVMPPLDKRRARWMNEIAEKLKELEDKKIINFQELQSNEQFIDVVLQATTYALKTSERAKIEAFRNAILQTAKGDTPDKVKSQIFLNQLDRFTVWHMKILNFIDSPREWFKRENKNLPSDIMSTLHSVIIEVFPELRNQDDLLDIIWDDLKTVGFHKSGGLNDMMSGDGTLSNRTTSFGKEFIKFIKNETE